MPDQAPETRQWLGAFRGALDREERSIRETLAKDDIGIYLRTAITELDWHYYNLVRVPDRTPEQDQQYYIMSLGTVRLVQLALDSRPAFAVPTLTLKHDTALAVETLRIVAHLGFIEQGRRVSDAVPLGLCAMNALDDGYEFVLPAQIVDHAWHERSVVEHYNAEQDRIFREHTSTDEARSHLQLIDQLLTENVRVWREHFIGYESDLVLDLHFLTLGELALRKSEGHDTFAARVEFGGIPFQKYYLATAFFISLALKHERFCEALVRKHPEISLRNILTITCERAGLAESIQEALNQIGPPHEGYTYTTLEQARKISEVLSVTRDSTSLLKRPHAPLPFAIEFSDTGFIRSLAGARQSPAHFLLSSLRHHFPKEYDRRQREREASMQRALQRELTKAFDNLAYRTNITVRRDGRSLTDIDLVVIDRTYGSVFLVQLKFQDLYGADVRAWGSRSHRLKEESMKWLQVLKEWMANPKRVRSDLRLAKDINIRNIYRVIVARHYAHALGDLDIEEDTAFATWLQFFNAIEFMKKTQGSIMTLAGLFMVLRKYVVSAPIRYSLDEEAREYNLDTLRFVVRQVEGQETNAPS